MSSLDDTLFATPEMARIFSGASLVQQMLDVEAALAEAQAAAGLIPAAAAKAIRAACRPDRFDVAALLRAADATGTPAAPLVAALTAGVPAEARGFVHLGATSQDIIDTGLVLQMRDGLDALEGGLRTVGDACVRLADQHRRTVMPGRTLLQHAAPVTFGLKAARWLGVVTRLLVRLREARPRVLVVQFGGAVGTLAALGREGPQVAALLARRLGLAAPDLPWHAERDRIAEVAGLLAATAGAMAKIAGDVALLAQTEVAEVSTPAQADGGRSSAMPHKRNPVEAVTARACARLAVGAAATLLAADGHEHERAAGAWQAEWAALPALFRHTSAAVDWTRRLLQGLRVDADRMRANLDATGGAVMAEALVAALAPTMGRDEAYRAVQAVTDRAARDGIGLRQAVAAETAISAALAPEAIARVLDPAAYLGAAETLIERALEAYRALPPAPADARRGTAS